MTNTMRAIEISEPGGPEVLRLTERPIPEPRHGEIVIKVAFAGVNRPDALQRAGSYKPPASASDLPGLEAAGEIAAIGDGVTGWSLGDQVCALLPGGGYAEYVSAPAAHALPVPQRHGAARSRLPAPKPFSPFGPTFSNAAGCRRGEVFLVHGGSSGIGTTAIQLASVFGARVFATAGSAEKCEVCSNLGAERAINYRDEDYVEVLRDVGGADLILDMVGGSYLPRNVKALKDDGRLVQIAFLQGPKVELNFAHLMMRRLTITGSTLRPQFRRSKGADCRGPCWPTSGRS